MARGQAKSGNGRKKVQTRNVGTRGQAMKTQVSDVANAIADQVMSILKDKIAGQSSAPMQVQGATASPTTANGRRGRSASTVTSGASTGVGAQNPNTIGTRGRKVAEIKEGLLNGKSDQDLVNKGFNLSTIRTIKWALRKSGELSKSM